MGSTNAFLPEQTIHSFLLHYVLIKRVSSILEKKAFTALQKGVPGTGV
jgi:hypothetical protein